MRIFKNKKILVALILILLSAGVGVKMRMQRQDGGVLSEPLQKGSIIESVYGIGTVTAMKSFQVKPGVTNTIHELYVEEGSRVQKGQKLLSLDGANPVAAPFDGTITYLPFKIGENIFAQSVVLTLVDLSDRYVVVSLEQRGALRVNAGQKARISFDSMRGDSFEGVVQSVYSNDNNFFVRINVSGLPRQILPGMTADVAIGIVEHQDVLLAPVAAINQGMVSVQRDGGSPLTIEVKTGIVDGAMAEIVSGDLRAGDRLWIRDKVGP